MVTIYDDILMFQSHKMAIINGVHTYVFHFYQLQSIQIGYSYISYFSWSFF